MPVRDRTTGDAVDEPLPHGPLLRAAYAPGPWLAGAAGPLVSEVVGWAARQPWSASRIPGFIASQGVDPTTIDRALDAYDSLDAFFARPIPADARPVAEAPSVASPCDGAVRAWATVGAHDRLPVKGRTPTLTELVGDPALAARLDGAAVALIRLAPGDLHRVILPFDGVLDDVITLGGPLHSVHPVAVDAGAPALHNRRLVVPIGHHAALVAIGALNVGSVEVLARPGPADRGTELATFHLGGSAVVLVARGLSWDEDLVEATARGEETRVRLGERVGTRTAAANVVAFPGAPAPSTASVARPSRPAPAPEPPSLLRLLDPPNLVTLASLGVAFAAVVASLHLALRPAFVLLGASAVLDALDGALARRWADHADARRLGTHLDTLVDACAFGLAPAVVLHQAGLHGPVELLVLTALPLAVVLRLAWFAAHGRPDRFRGMPSTAAGVLIPVVGLLVLVDVDAFRIGATSLAAALVVAMLAPVAVPRPGRLANGLLALLGGLTLLAWVLLPG